MPRLASSLTTRTRRARPSENTDLRVIPGFSPRGHPSSDHQSGGGAGSARPRCRHNAKRNVPSFRAPASFQLVRNHGLPRLASGQYSRARRPRPSEKTAFHLIPGLSPLGHPSLDGPPRGGAGSARPQTRLCLHRGIAPLGHQAFVCPRWLCYASACVRPCNAGAETAPLRENRPPRHVYQQNRLTATRALLGYPMHLRCITSPVPPFFASANTSSHRRKPLE
jgi:hypothetical protein